MSWGTGIILIGIMCFFLGYLALKIKHYGLRIIFILLTPFLLSYSVYWGIAWAMGMKGNSEFDSWSGLFVEVWAVAGLLSLLVGLLVFSYFGKHRTKNG
jgi:hypothetical protein